MLRLLGPPTVVSEGVRRPWPPTRPGALLAYLACRGDWVGRDELALVLRPDVPDAEARRYLRQLLHRAASFPWARDLEIVSDRVRWNARSDLSELRAALASGDGAALGRMPPPRPLLEGYAPPGGAAFDAWLELEREQLARAWSDATVRYAQAREAEGDLLAAIEARERVLAVETLEESVLQALMHACLRAGLAERAVSAFDRFARALELDLGQEPLEATLTLADAARRAPGTTPPARREAAAPTVAVPRPTTSLIGRRSELARLRAWLEGEARWITITGLGGVGKTRLMLELGHQAAGAFERGARFLPLASLQGVDEVLGAVASRLGMATSGAPSTAGIAAHLGDESLLLLLDEAEHVASASFAGELRALLEAAPGLRLVVTGREPLGAAAEHVLRLDGLPLAEERARPAGTGLGGAEDDGHHAADDAAALFYRRADRLGVSVVADDATDAAVRALCRAVDGLPLAIELAAAQARMRPVRAVLAELEAGADVLRTDAPDVPERHRSVRALLRQAWASLDGTAREALVRLTVFEGGCSLAAAQRVAGADLETVLTLLDRSLLRRVSDDRFEVHALVRRAAPDAPDDATRDAHAVSVLGRLAELTHDIRGGSGQPSALDEVHGSIADVRRAWQRALERGFTLQLEAALTAIDHAVHARSLWDLADSLYRAAADALGAESGGPRDERVRRLWATVQVRLANVERQRSDTERARRRLASVLTGMPQREPAAGADRRLLIEARLELAKLDEAVNAYAAAEHGYRAVLAAGVPGRDDDCIAQAHDGLANVLFLAGGDTSEAMEHYERALSIARGLGELDLLSITLINLGAGHFDLGQVGAARRRWLEAADAARRIGHRQREAVVMNNLGSLAEATGDHEGARSAFERSLAMRLELGDRPGAARVLLNLGRLAQRTGLLDEADAYLEASVRQFERLDQPADLALALATRARVRVALDDLPFARRASERALRLARVAGDRNGMLAGLLAVATVQAALGRRARALAITERVLHHSEGREAGIFDSAQALWAELRASPRDMEPAAGVAGFEPAGVAEFEPAGAAADSPGGELPFVVVAALHDLASH
jgi:predicted ATPase/DNA-binding SARP family transcriptional activator/tetratricopeptide (TPR) repeat protein